MPAGLNGGRPPGQNSGGEAMWMSWVEVQYRWGSKVKKEGLSLRNRCDKIVGACGNHNH